MPLIELHLVVIANTACILMLSASSKFVFNCKTNSIVKHYDLVYIWSLLEHIISPTILFLYLFDLYYIHFHCIYQPAKASRIWWMNGFYVVNFFVNHVLDRSVWHQRKRGLLHMEEKESICQIFWLHERNKIKVFLAKGLKVSQQVR